MGVFIPIRSTGMREVTILKYTFASRLAKVPESFLDELFRVSADPSIISFAGGLPSSALIDTDGIAQATRAVLEEDAGTSLQYTTTDGFLPLREYIAARYRSRLGITASADEIQIVNGSQQCLDLFAKIFLDAGDAVAMERPGYLGAIEAFSLYEPRISAVRLNDDGLDLPDLEQLVTRERPRFFYGIPNSQNPSGKTYSQENRKAVAEILSSTSTVFYEDDAFGELFFDTKPRQPVKKYLPDQTVISGSFSKIIAPGMRIGWMFAPRDILKRFNIVKQAADLHSNFFCQKILHRYLTTVDLDARLRMITTVYQRKCRIMCDLLDDLLPDLTHTRPEGGMFLMAGLPAGLSSRRVFDEGVKKKVAVLPGLPFYIDGGGLGTIRLNFSSPSEEQIQEGMTRLAHVVTDLR
jgi:2-aminoadipate transaminase